MRADPPALLTGRVRPGRTSGSRSVVAALAGRWPTWLAIAVSALSWGGTPLKALSEALLLFPLGYLAVAAVGRRGITWPVGVVGIVALAVLRLQERVDHGVVLLGAAVVLVAYAAVRGRFWPPGEGLLQTAGWVGFAAVALLAVAVEPELGKYVIAVGWFGHALWDFYHWIVDRGVSRSFAEWCGVFDLLGAVAIVLFPAS